MSFDSILVVPYIRLWASPLESFPRIHPSSFRDWCVAIPRRNWPSACALGAVSLNERPGPDGTLAHALVKLGPEMVMIEAEWPSLPSRAPAMDGTSPVVIFVYVPNVDETVERATECGARVLVPLADQFWGDRTALLMDPAGHVWTIATRVEQTTAEERTDRWNKAVRRNFSDRDRGD